MLFNKVFEITFNPDEFRILNETLLEQTIQSTNKQILNFFGESLKAQWQPIGITWLEFDAKEYHQLKTPDIASLGSSCYVIPAHLATYFESLNCEMLECYFDNHLWYIINVVGFENAIDKDKTIFNLRSNGKVHPIRKFKRFVVNKQQINNPELFRIQGAGLNYFTTDCENSLYSMVKKHNLTGVEFKEIEIA